MDNNEFKRGMFTGDLEVPEELEARINAEVDSIKVKKRSLLKVISASAAVLIILIILSVSFIPPLRACARNIPFLSIFIDLIHKDEGLKKANENGYLPISNSVTAKSNGYEFTVGNVFLDEQRMSFVCVIKPDKSIKSNKITKKTLKRDMWQFNLVCRNMKYGVISSGPKGVSESKLLVYAYDCVFTEPYYYKKFMLSKPKYLNIDITKYPEDNKKKTIVGRVRVPLNKKYIQKSKNINIDYNIKSKRLNPYIKECTIKGLSMSATMMTLQVYIKPKKGFVNPAIDGTYIKDENGNVSNTSPDGCSSSLPNSNSVKGGVQSIYLMPSLYYSKNIKKLYVGFKDIKISEEHGKKRFIIDTTKKHPTRIKFNNRTIIVSNSRIEGKYLIFDTKVSYYMKNIKEPIQSFTESYEEEQYRNWSIRETNDAVPQDIKTPDRCSYTTGLRGHIEAAYKAKVRVLNTNQKKYVIFIRDIDKRLGIKGEYLIKLNK